MRPRHQSALVLTVGVFAALAGLSVGTARGQKGAPDSSREDKAEKAAFEAVCLTCHPLGMVDGIRSELEWRETFELMVKIGATGTDEQIDRAMRFLLHNLTKVNVNTATASEIAPVLGVSDAAAQAIVERRTRNGGFKTIEELKKVRGVDAAKLEGRRDRIVF
jgi:competence protein ComEA